MGTTAPTTAYHSTHDLVRAVRLHFAPTWPLSMMVDARAMLIYAEAFAFLLQLKWAAWVLQCVGSGGVGGARSVAHGVSPVDTRCQPLCFCQHFCKTVFLSAFFSVSVCISVCVSCCDQLVTWSMIVALLSVVCG